MQENIENILKDLPKSPGIYQFFNEKWEIIYIWKSVRLKDRVTSYFRSHTKLTVQKNIMVRQIVDIKVILTNNETESLILERSLIKEHKPQYNILLKDDKNYYYIKITDEQFPKVIKTRFKTKSWKYFGPYTHGFYVSNLLRIIKKVYWYGCYGIHFFRIWNGYNLDKYIFKDNKNIEKTDITLVEIEAYYKSKISEIEEFLKWNVNHIAEELTRKMLSYAKELKFEEAAKLKTDIDSLRITQEEQIVRDFVNGNYDVINILEKYWNTYVWCIEIRNSVIKWYFNYEIENSLEEDKEEVLKTFIEKRFIDHLDEHDTATYIIPFQIHNLTGGIKTEVPKIWWKFDVLRLCYKNIYNFAHKKYLASLSAKNFTKSTMMSLLEILWYSAVNGKDIMFECNDISHLSGTHTVASRSIIENWRPNPKKYRKFHIKQLEQGKIDDFGSMKEILERRLLELLKMWNLPDLIIIDGWKGQLGSVIRIRQNFLDNLDTIYDSLDIHAYTLEQSRDIIQNLQIVSLAKQEEELFLPWKSKSILLSKDSQELRLVQAIRDEAHRFAITFNRDSRSASMKKNILESIPWIWPVTRKKIIRIFGSVGWLKAIKKEIILEKLWNKVTTILDDHGLLAE